MRLLGVPGTIIDVYKSNLNVFCFFTRSIFIYTCLKLCIVTNIVLSHGSKNLANLSMLISFSQN